MTQQYPPQPPPQPPYGPDPRQWQAYNQAPPPPAPKKRKWPWVVGGLFVLFFVVPALGNSGKPSTTASTTTASSGPAPPAAAQAAPAVIETPAAETAPAGPQTSFGDGTWVVGEDIVPGIYKTGGAKQGIFEYCQITTHSDTEAESNFLEWKNGNANEPIRVKISGKVKSVKASGCEDFVKVG